VFTDYDHLMRLDEWFGRGRHVEVGNG